MERIMSKTQVLKEGRDFTLSTGLSVRISIKLVFFFSKTQVKEGRDFTFPTGLPVWISIKLMFFSQKPKSRRRATRGGGGGRY
jgi:Holliday junction resolvase RusA-like endonuclease